MGGSPEPGSGGDLEGDSEGRGSFNAGWGNVHNEIGIEILEMSKGASQIDFLPSLSVVGNVDLFLSFV